MILSALHKLRLSRYKKRGLQIADDCRLMGMPFFGTEPYLISIGKRVTISGKVAFITHDGATWVFRHLPLYAHVRKFGRITVHDNCFIGYGAVILPGVTIGPNSVVGANSLVTKDVPPNTVAGGVPARPLIGVEDYAEKCLKTNAVFDEAVYAHDKKDDLLRLYPYPW